MPDGTGLSLATTCHPSVQRLGHQDKLEKKKFGQKEKKGLMTVWILISMLVVRIKSTWTIDFSGHAMERHKIAMNGCWLK